MHRYALSVHERPNGVPQYNTSGGGGTLRGLGAAGGSQSTLMVDHAVPGVLHLPCHTILMPIDRARKPARSE